MTVMMQMLNDLDGRQRSVFSVLVFEKAEGT